MRLLTLRCSVLFWASAVKGRKEHGTFARGPSIASILRYQAGPIRTRESSQPPNIQPQTPRGSCQVQSRATQFRSVQLMRDTTSPFAPTSISKLTWFLPFLPFLLFPFPFSLQIIHSCFPSPSITTFDDRISHLNAAF